MASLQDQFLKAGLVGKKEVKQLNQEKSKQKKIERRTGTQSVDEARLAAQETQRKNAERARELNIQRDAAAMQKAILAQIVQMVQKNRQRHSDQKSTKRPPQLFPAHPDRRRRCRHSSW